MLSTFLYFRGTLYVTAITVMPTTRASVQTEGYYCRKVDALKYVLVANYRILLGTYVAKAQSLSARVGGPQMDRGP